MLGAIQSIPCELRTIRQVTATEAGTFCTTTKQQGKCFGGLTYAHLDHPSYPLRIRYQFEAQILFSTLSLHHAVHGSRPSHLSSSPRQ
eukprot:2956676-Amphidinium_carterae.1